MPPICIHPSFFHAIFYNNKQNSCLSRNKTITKSPVTKATLAFSMYCIQRLDENSTTTVRKHATLYGVGGGVGALVEKRYWNLGGMDELKNWGGEAAGSCGWTDRSENEAVFLWTVHRSAAGKRRRRRWRRKRFFSSVLSSSLSGCEDKPVPPRHPWDKKKPVCCFFFFCSGDQCGGFELTTSQKSSVWIALFQRFSTHIHKYK